jgi:hypothetical protein
MTRASFAPLIGREFDSFLTAAVGDDPDGMRLSVLSAFARTDLDPWAEAASLAKMPSEKATARLAAFIAGIPNRPGADVPAKTIAANLVALLPKADRIAPRTAPALDKIMAPASATSTFGLGFSAIALMIVLALIAMAEPKAGPHSAAYPAAPIAQTLPPPVAAGQ